MRIFADKGAMHKHAGRAIGRLGWAGGRLLSGRAA